MTSTNQSQRAAITDIVTGAHGQASHVLLCAVSGHPPASNVISFQEQRIEFFFLVFAMTIVVIAIIVL